jgi:glutamate formiminotransferase/formiminotetrahydrofolate cyclodeaminase
VDARAPYAELTLADFVERLASAEPVPGGGSASAVAGSMAAALLSMVSRLSTDRPKYETYALTHARALGVADAAQQHLLELADEDARAYAAFGAARKLPRETESEQRVRDEATRVAARGASDVPLEVLRECARVVHEVEAMAGRSNLNASSDLEVAARLAAAAARGAAANVLINLPMVGDESYAGHMTAEVTQLLEDIERSLANTSELVRAGTLREPEAT